MGLLGAPVLAARQQCPHTLTKPSGGGEAGSRGHPAVRRGPVTPPGAVIFDLDGTLVDNMPVHAEAFSRFMRELGLPGLSPEQRRRLDGKRNRDIFPELLGRSLEPAELRAFAARKEALYRELSRGRLVPLPGLLRLLDRLDDQGIPRALATSAPRENVPHTLGELGVLERFPVVVRADQVPRGKPHPDVFLEAARRMHTPPETCLVFEDTPAGIRGARAAGMSCVAVATSFPASRLAADTGADGVVTDYEAWLAAPVPEGVLSATRRIRPG